MGQRGTVAPVARIDADHPADAAEGAAIGDDDAPGKESRIQS